MPYRSSPLGQHLNYFLFLQIYFWAAGLFTLAVNGLETYLLVTSVSRDTSFMLYPPEVVEGVQDWLDHLMRASI